MSTYSQFNYPYATTVSQLPTATSAAPSTVMSSVTGTGTGGSTACCETGRPVATDPVTGQVICSCQYESARLSLNSYAPRLGSGTALSYGTASYPSTEHNPYPSIGVDSAAYFSQFTTPYGLKEGAPGDVAMYGSIGGSPGYGYTYDPSLYGYGAPYDLAARRKNATREATGTLKAWLNEHKTNPYPTKGEKIMLAIITKMTLTQVSTWFANARRRLKKENKMTWEPKTKADSDDDGDKGSDAAESVDKELEEDKDSLHTSLVSNVPSLPKSHLKTEVLSPEDDCKESIFSDDCSDLQKPKIWSLADTAACKSPANQGAWSTDRVPPQGASAASTFPLPASIPPYNRFNQRQSYSMSSTGGYRQMTTSGTSLSESGSPHDSSSAAMSPGVYGHQAGPSATGGSAASSLHYTAGSSVYGGGTSGLQHPVSSHQTGSMYSSGAPVDVGGGASAVFSTGSPVDSYKTELQGGPELLQSRYRLPCHQSAAGSSGSQSAYQSMSQSTPHSLQLPPSAAAHHMI